jgi:geranylgeranyl pyrophosphate synthase
MNAKLEISTHSLVSEVEARMRAQFSDKPSALVTTLEELILADRQGIRPTIVLLLGGMFGAERESILNLAAAIEMMHTATLVHDNLAGETGQGHGHPTVHTRFATSATVLAGDLAFAAAARLAAATNRITVMQKFSETLQFIVNGGITHLFSNGDRADLRAYYARIHAKTASIFELASSMAATIGSASPAEISAATQFGYNIGMAFQITDDILDFTGDPSALGKPVGSNLRQGTITLPTLLYLEAHPDDLDIGSIPKRNGNGQGRIDSDIISIITAIRQSKVIDQAMQEADRFTQQGLDALARLPGTPERTELEHLARQITNREPC